MNVTKNAGPLLVGQGTRRSSTQPDPKVSTDTMQEATEHFKILVADDSRIYRSLVETVLAEAGYKLLFAQNGREAFSAIEKHEPSLLITDWEMPDITGLELCRKIRQDHERYVHIILLTSNTEKDQIIEGLDAGADDYLTKPFHPGELLARVAVGRRVAELHRQIQAKNLLLEQLAQTDSLTGLPNRRAIEDWTKRELSGAERHGFALWLVIADLDHFKSINDTYGHGAGDLVLQRFAELLRENTRASNLCGRIGGEEFVLALSHVDRSGVETAVERIRRQFEAEMFTFDGKVITATASFGITGFQGRNAPSLDNLLREADAALYLAKGKGRNRLEFSS
ncbi:MAG TPA: diguanylate cyclase [Candidatus Sulfotelmatobacter sp.]|nr:diguanylate cyclase [Candidatus Sulfotelmatobacter sp.]